MRCSSTSRPIIRDENGFNGSAHQLRNGKGEWQAGVVSAGFDGVDGLSADTQAIGQFLLGPAALGAQHSESILHIGPFQTGLITGRFLSPFPGGASSGYTCLQARM